MFQGRVNSKDAVEEAVFLFGSVYDKDTLKQSGTSYSAPVNVFYYLFSA